MGSALSPAFLKQVTADEAVMDQCVIAMASEDQLTAAVYRLSGTINFPHLVARLAMARRNRQADEANSLCAEIMWCIEDEVMAQCRREYEKRSAS